MSFFKGVSTQNSANPLNVTDLANVFGYILANPNGVVSFCIQCLTCTTLKTRLVSLSGPHMLHIDTAKLCTAAQLCVC